MLKSSKYVLFAVLIILGIADFAGKRIATSVQSHIVAQEHRPLGIPPPPIGLR